MYFEFSKKFLFEKSTGNKGGIKMNGTLYGEYDTSEEFYREESSFCDEDTCEKCDYCGYPILRGEEKLRVDSTGDIIHRKCWNDYAEDNTDELCTPLDLYGRRERR